MLLMQLIDVVRRLNVLF